MLPMPYFLTPEVCLWLDNFCGHPNNWNRSVESSICPCLWVPRCPACCFMCEMWHQRPPQSAFVQGCGYPILSRSMQLSTIMCGAQIGDRLRAIQVRMHKVGVSVCFHLMRSDGTLDDVSANKCLATLFPKWGKTRAAKVRVPCLAAITGFLHTALARAPA